MAENQSTNSSAPRLRYPDLRIGYVCAAVSLSWWIVKPQIDSPSAVIILFFCAAGSIYWYRCVFHIHSIMKKITGGKIPYDPSQAVAYLFIPLFNIFWAFVWISRIARSLNGLRGSGKVKVVLPALFLSVSLSVWTLCYFFPLFLFGGFLVLSYLVENIRETVALDEAGTKIITGNISRWEARPKAKNRILARLVKTAAVILLLAFANLPRLLLFPVHREGLRIVPLIEDYKIKRGVYPDSLSQLGDEIRYQDRMRYETRNKGAEFLLVCYGGWTTRMVYHSTYKKWNMLD